MTQQILLFFFSELPIYHSKKKKNTLTKQYYSVCTITIITGSSCLDFICKTHTSIIKLFFSIEKLILTWIFFSIEPHKKKTHTHAHATPRASIALIFLTICNTLFFRIFNSEPAKSSKQLSSPATEGHRSNIRDRKQSVDRNCAAFQTPRVSVGRSSRLRTRCTQIHAWQLGHVRLSIVNICS